MNKADYNDVMNVFSERMFRYFFKNSKGVGNTYREIMSETVSHYKSLECYEYVIFGMEYTIQCVFEDKRTHVFDGFSKINGERLYKKVHTVSYNLEERDELKTQIIEICSTLLRLHKEFDFSDINEFLLDSLIPDIAEQSAENIVCAIETDIRKYAI